MKKRIIGGAIAVALLFGGFMWIATSPAVAINSSDQNQETYWENLGYGECEKHEADGASANAPGPHGTWGDKDDSNEWTSFTTGTPPNGKYFSLLVVKASTTRDVNVNPGNNTKYFYSGGKAISHVIICEKDNVATTTTTTVGPTTTDGPETSLIPPVVITQPEQGTTPPVVNTAQPRFTG